jgi:hypothetical protein
MPWTATMIIHLAQARALASELEVQSHRHPGCIQRVTAA